MKRLGLVEVERRLSAACVRFPPSYAIVFRRREIRAMQFHPVVARRKEPRRGSLKTKAGNPPMRAALRLKETINLACILPVVAGLSCDRRRFRLGSGLRMSMPPLKNAPSSMLMRAAATSPLSEPSARMSTRSVAETLPRTLPSTTISRAVMLAATWPLRPTVTRLPGRLMLPSTLPSIKSDSEPVISPLIYRPLPMVACSPVTAGGWTAGGSTTGAGGSGTGRFRGGGWASRSGLVGFPHCAQGISFSVLMGRGCQGRAICHEPKNLKNADCRA